MRRLTTPSEIEEAARLIAETLGERGEWFLREGRGHRTVELKRGEWELQTARRALFFSYWGAQGSRVWRVAAWERDGDALRLEAARRAGAERATLELVPRASAAAAREALRAARLRVCEKLSGLLARTSGLRVEAARLSAGARRGEPGRYARILLGGGSAGTRHTSVAATGPVVPEGGEGAEGFLASALLWLARLEERGRRPAELWLAADAKLTAALTERLPLLREELRRRVVLFEAGEGLNAAARREAPTLSELLARPAAELYRPTPPRLSELVASVVALAPAEVDVVRARHGETLRFLGLAFARVRRIGGRELVWFGVGASKRRRLLCEENKEELLQLVSELAEHRRADAADRRHQLHRAAPEAWLESILRRDVTRLDPGLRLAPLHAQFRAARGEREAGARPVDLLALRRDGRLVVIELKVSEDAALPLQGADYWRRVETLRRRGHLKRARLFGDAEIADTPPLVYLVAPLLSFHRSFDALSRALRPEIETYRFDLNEDWRAGVRVARRSRVG
jgi:hypothetical protein